MTRPRKEIVCVEKTPYYHITSRCVRRAFLCGFDEATQTSYEHRRDWVEDRIRLLSSIFSIDVCAYAVMSNHYHIVIKLNPTESFTWSHEEVMQRWLTLFKGTTLIQKYQKNETLSGFEMQTVIETLQVYKERLADLSWFMKCLNEFIARRANHEDGCTGHFWEARYNSPALTSEKALITCMAYVDLNPIRSGLADRPEQSDHTSIKERLTQQHDLQKSIEGQLRAGGLRSFDLTVKPLVSFSEGFDVRTESIIPMRFSDYLKLVDWTGRVIRTSKTAAIPLYLRPILKRVQISPEAWLLNTTRPRAFSPEKTDFATAYH